MLTQMTSKRYELKYLMTRGEAARLKEAMKDHMELDRFGHSTIRNIYLDTASFRLVRRSMQIERSTRRYTKSPAISRFKLKAGLQSFPNIPYEVVHDFDFLLLLPIHHLRLPNLYPLDQRGDDLRRQLLHFREPLHHPDELLRLVRGGSRCGDLSPQGFAFRTQPFLLRFKLR